MNKEMIDIFIFHFFNIENKNALFAFPPANVVVPHYLDLMVTLYLIVWETFKLFSKEAASFYIPTQMCMKVPIAPHPHQLLWSVFLL